MSLQNYYDVPGRLILVWISKMSIDWSKRKSWLWISAGLWQVEGDTRDLLTLRGWSSTAAAGSSSVDGGELILAFVVLTASLFTTSGEWFLLLDVLCRPGGEVKGWRPSVKGDSSRGGTLSRGTIDHGPWDVFGFTKRMKSLMPYFILVFCLTPLCLRLCAILLIALNRG